jgi:cytoskeletal protein RodZ
MGLILLEALLALVLIVGIVWWTMFSGRKKGELPQTQEAIDHETGPSEAQAPKSAPKDKAS